MLVLVVGAAAALLLSVPALGAGVLSTEQTAITAPQSQQSPAIAVDPDAPLRAAVVADDGNVAPPYPHTATSSTTDWSAPAWSAPPGVLPHSGTTSAGQADIAWGLDAGGTQKVYAVETGASGGSVCSASGGVFLSASSDGGATYGTALQVNSGGSDMSESLEPAIAVDRTINRVYVAYATLTFGQAGCNGSPDSSQIFLAYTGNEGSTWTRRRVSPLATSGSAHYRSPSLAVLPDGRVIVAFRDDASAQIETETCTSPSPPTGSYCGSGAGLVGPSTVVGDATAPSVVSGIAGPPTPSVVAAGGRVTVAWHAGTPGAVHAFAAMSTDGGATFGPPEQIDPDGAGNQVAPVLAATADGRVDVAYLWDTTGTGVVAATSASAAPPLPGAPTEAWGNPVVVQSAGASGTTGIFGATAPLGRRLGIATTWVPTALSPLTQTVIAFTDTSGTSQDVHVVGLLHGTSAPVIAPQTVTASKNTSTIVHVDATDADGDPLTWSTGAQPTTPGSSVSTANQARGQFAFNAADKVGTDTFEAVATDGVPGHETRAMINVNVVNDPPEIICSVLIAREDTPLPIQVSDCVKDPNKDPVTMSLDGATGGSVERIAGTWFFVPKLHSTASGSFVLHATDGDLTQAGTVLVTVVGAIGTVTLDVPDAGKTRTIASGTAVRLVGHAVDAAGHAIPVSWNFGDKTSSVSGPAVAHRFRRAGKFVITATASSATPKKITVIVRRRAVELAGTPSIVDGVMQLTVRTRAAGKLLLRADSRSQTIAVPAGLTEQTLRIQVTTGPLVRLTLRLTPSGRKSALQVLVFSVRRLVLVSPLSAV